MRQAGWLFLGIWFALQVGCGALSTNHAQATLSNLQRAKIFLSAGDYRRAIEASQKEIAERPSVNSYVYLAYIYQALDAYLDFLARSERWVMVEQLVTSFSPGKAGDLLDQPDVLARIAKEVVHDSATKQFDVAAAAATRLDEGTAAKLWEQQRSWRTRKPDGWWFGVPEEWGW